MVPTLSKSVGGQRILAFLLDYAIISIYLGVLFVVGFSLVRIGVLDSSPPSSPILADIIAFLLSVLPVTLFMALQEGSSLQATMGKRWRRLRVTTLSGGRVSMRRALVRSAVKFLPWQVAHTSLFHIPGWPTEVQFIPAGSLAGLILSQGAVVACILIILLSRSGRAPHDWIAGTRVVEEDHTER
jgi:uncharacterized RDD family membrane protein YckC